MKIKTKISYLQILDLFDPDLQGFLLFFLTRKPIFLIKKGTSNFVFFSLHLKIPRDPFQTYTECGHMKSVGNFHEILHKIACIMKYVLNLHIYCMKSSQICRKSASMLHGICTYVADCFTGVPRVPHEHGSGLILVGLKLEPHLNTSPPWLEFYKL